MHPPRRCTDAADILAEDAEHAFFPLARDGAPADPTTSGRTPTGCPTPATTRSAGATSGSAVRARGRGADRPGYLGVQVVPCSAAPVFLPWCSRRPRRPRWSPQAPSPAAAAPVPDVSVQVFDPPGDADNADKVSVRSSTATRHGLEHQPVLPAVPRARWDQYGVVRLPQPVNRLTIAGATPGTVVESARPLGGRRFAQQTSSSPP
ncbi:hypothetical protein HBB16_07985 [Pseudonocardia sp. MCCB 268]|nr:hypothetical protein [Pseudonocardia cytotoxica]